MCCCLHAIAAVIVTMSGKTRIACTRLALLAHVFSDIIIIVVGTRMVIVMVIVHINFIISMML